jgi:hypothetical protein
MINVINSQSNLITQLTTELKQFSDARIPDIEANMASLSQIASMACAYGLATSTMGAITSAPVSILPSPQSFGAITTHPPPISPQNFGYHDGYNSHQLVYLPTSHPLPPYQGYYAGYNYHNPQSASIDHSYSYHNSRGYNGYGQRYGQQNHYQNSNHY